MPPPKTIASLHAEMLQLREIIERQDVELMYLRKQLEEIDPMVQWLEQIHAMKKAGKIAFAVVGGLLGLIISILTIIQLWPLPG